MSAKFPITLRGADLLRKELQRLKTVDRPTVIAAIAEARSHGDLSENAEYDAAKERQGFIEGRIKEVEGKLGNAQIIDPASLDADGRVVFGSTVELEDLESGNTVTYQIVGEDEADIIVVGEALLGLERQLAQVVPATIDALPVERERDDIVDHDVRGQLPLPSTGPLGRGQRGVDAVRRKRLRQDAQADVVRDPSPLGQLRQRSRHKRSSCRYGVIAANRIPQNDLSEQYCL